MLERFVLVTSVKSPKGTHASTVPFSLARDQLDRTQPVSVHFGGFEYPGEVIVAIDWQAEFGGRLTGVAMFRLVLLQSSRVPSPDQINDKRICVAVQDSPKPAGRRIRESSATYNVNGGEDGAQSRSSAEADIRSIREVWSTYVTANDPGLGRLASALVDYESKINGSLVGDSHRLWKSGRIVTNDSFEGLAIRPSQVFLLDDPESWLEVAASNVLDQCRFSSGSSTPDEIYTALQRGKLKTAGEQLRIACGLHLGAPTPVDSMRRLAGESSGAISSEQLVDFLIHEMAFPPAIANLWIVMYALETDSEIELVQANGEPKSLSNDNISEFPSDDVTIDLITGIRAEKSDDWDAVLPFLKLIVPHANSTRYGGGRDSDFEEFRLQLAAVHDRVLQASPLMLSLEIATGATGRPLTHNAFELLEVLGVSAWQQYVTMARKNFGSVAALRKSISDAAHHWAITELVAEIEQAIYYLDRVEFGRIDHALAVEQQLLRSRFELKFLVENTTNWLSLRSEFERWRQDYRRAYLEDHDQKQDQNRLVQSQIDRTNRQLARIALLERVEAVRIGENSNVAELWSQTIRTFSVCENDGSNISLIDDPVCPKCRSRLGQPTSHTDIAGMISEIDQLFDGYRDRLASVVSQLVLKSQSADKLQSLFRLNSAGDLSDLANVLDDKVISFLNELFGKTSGNIGDWTSPHS